MSSVSSIHGARDGKFLSTLTVGKPNFATGKIQVDGTTSGRVTITTAAAAGTWTLTLPTGAGTLNYPLVTNGSGVTSWSATTAITGLGTVTTGVWNGTAVAAQYGGTGINSSASTGLPYLVSAGVWSVSTTQTPQVARLGLGAAADGISLLNLNGTLVHGTATGVTVGSTTATALFNVGTSAQFQVSSTGAISTTSTGPHAIGGGVATGSQVNILGSFTPASGAVTQGIAFTSTLTPAVASGDIWGFRVTPTLVEFSSGVHPTITGIYVQPIITAGVATTTDLIGIDIASITAATGTTNATGIRVAAPTGATNNFAINITSGDIYKAGTAYNNPDFALEMWATGKIDMFANRDGANRYRQFSLSQVREFAQQNYYLPQLDFFDAHSSASGGFERHDISLIIHEDTFRYLWEHEDRIATLESRELYRRVQVFEENNEQLHRQITAIEADYATLRRRVRRLETLYKA